jgi:DNA-binding beta-propeller fold protein YncE
MKRRILAVTVIALLSLAGLLLGQAKKSKAPEQGYVPEGWHPHEGGLLKYAVDIRFGLEPEHTMPEGWFFGRVSAAASDTKGEVYVFHRNIKIDPIVVFDNNGKYLRSWGKDLFDNPHGIRIDPEGNVWCVDNNSHQVRKFTRDGKLLLTLGVRGERGNDETHFGSPTDIAWDRKTGDFYVSDGYGNSRVMKFNKDGKFLLTWGKPGSAPGEFQTVHAVATDSQGRVYISDRSNERIQIFTAQGEFLKQWTHLGATQGLDITAKDELWVVTHRNKEENIVYDTLAGRIMKIDIETGKVLASMESPGHMLDVNDANGEILIGSLTGNALRWYPSPTFERLRRRGVAVQPKAPSGP